MSRVHTPLPDHFPFSTQIPVEKAHCNDGGHLDNLVLLSLLTTARSRWWQSLGYHERDIEGLGIVIADAALQYRTEAFEGEVLHIEMTANDFNRRGCDIVWRVSECDTGREVARGKWGVVFFDYRVRKVAELPAAFRARWP